MWYMSLTQTQIKIIGGGVLAVALFIGIFIYLIPYLNRGSSDEPTTKITLNVWGIEDASHFGSIFSQYKAAHPLVTVLYTQIPEDRYEKTLLNAMATDQGPDIFMTHRSWINRYSDRIMSASQEQLTPAQVSSLFPDIVYRDFIFHDYVYALPLYIDSLALLYNKDLFNQKGVAVTPKTWGDIKTLIPYFTEFTPNKQIKKSAIALGGSAESIPNASDIISLFMLQGGSQSIERPDQRITFDTKAEQGVARYNQFSTPTNASYVWSDSFKNANDAFGSGDVAMSLHYSREIPTLINKNPYLNFAVTGMPQDNPSAPVNYADYWGLTVSLKSPNIKYAWNFIIAATTDPTLASIYLKQSGNPPALRELINTSLKDPNFGVFAKQALTAHAPFQYDVTGYRNALSQGMEAILNGQFNVTDALSKTSAEINKLY
jgi:ABC-type glycerol-3-phosphate transport system substrate-binding protein